MEWRAVVGWERIYEVSSEGQVRRVLGGQQGATPGRILKPTPHKNGYLQIGLHHNGKRKVLLVQRVVATAFHGLPRPGDEARHMDGNQTNNRASNLRWGTHADNVQDSVALGTHFSANRGRTHCRRGHEFTPENTYENSGRRHCRQCMKDRALARRAD